MEKPVTGEVMAMKTFLPITFIAGMLLATAGGRARQEEPVKVFDAGAGANAPGWHEQSIPVADTQRWYRYYLPTNAAASPAVVVLLHGGTMSMRKQFERRVGGAHAWIEIADKEGFILLVPNGTNPETGDTRGDEQNWNDLRAEGSGRHARNDDVKFIRDLLDWTIATLHANPRRVYVTGASNGGMMTYRMVIDASDRIAAAAAFIATLPADLPGMKQPARPVPLMIVNGTDDPIMKWGGGHIPAGGPDQSSTPDTVAWWIKADHATTNGVTTEALPDTDPKDHCRVYRTLYPPESGGAPVLFYKIEGGGHAMPSREHQFREGPIIQKAFGLPRDVEGADLAWTFMKGFTSPQPGEDDPSLNP
ncbi:MAG: PHB depolymerase family esterase [bacterium]